METLRMRTKIDWWIGVLLVGAMIGMVLTILLAPDDERLIGLLIGVPMFILIGSFVFGTYYELRDEMLYIRCGPFFEKIPYEKIESVKLSTGFLSSMALSVKRIEIRQKGKGFILGTTYISPVEREVFYEALKKRCRL